MKKLLNSGYDSKYRKQILISGKKAWAKMKEAEIKGEKPIYRPRTWREKERREEKRNKVRGWYKKGGFDSKMFVPATPGAELKKRVEKEMEGTGSG